MVPLIFYKKEKLLQEMTIEALTIRVAIGASTAEFSSKVFSGETAIACSGYLGEPVDKAIIDKIFKRPSMKGIDYSNNIYRFIGIHLALTPPNYDELDNKFARFTIKNKFLVSCFFYRYESILKVEIKDRDDTFSKLLNILYNQNDLSTEDEQFINEKLAMNEAADASDIVLYHRLEKKFSGFKFKNIDSVDLIKRIFNNFQDSIKHLTSNRRKGHALFEISDEYDVQDLSYLVLRSVFDKLQFENPHLKSGGTNSKVDLMLVDEGIDIELKMIKQTDADEKSYIKQIKIDINDYAAWRDLKNLIVFIYDPFNKTTNKNNFYELAGEKTINGVSFNVHIIVSN